MQPLVSDETTGSRTRSGFTRRNAASHSQAIHPPAVTHQKSQDPLHESHYCRNATYVPLAPTRRAYSRNELSFHDSCYLIRCGGARQTEQRIADQTNHYADIQQYPFGVTFLITHIFPADSFMEQNIEIS